MIVVRRIWRCTACGLSGTLTAEGKPPATCRVCDNPNKGAYKYKEVKQ